jgi:hypothetical protein
MNGVKNETHVRVEQTARGIWFCSGLDVYGDNTNRLDVELRSSIQLIENVLHTYNDRPGDGGKEDVTVVTDKTKKPSKTVAA